MIGSRKETNKAEKGSFTYIPFRYILAALMVVIIQNTDHIMLTAMIGTVENGYYAAAITTAGIVQFVYVAIIDSCRPMILSFKKEDGVQYEKSICSIDERADGSRPVRWLWRS